MFDVKGDWDWCLGGVQIFDKSDDHDAGEVGDYKNVCNLQKNIVLYYLWYIKIQNLPYNKNLVMRQIE